MVLISEIIVVVVFYTPQCKDELKPYKGKQFPTIDAAVQFYKDYARAVGFDVRMSSAKKSGDTLTWK